MELFSELASIRGTTMSEKFDGVNATWNGKSVVSRDGNAFAAPDWFVAGLPQHALTGELWIGRGRFEELCSIVRSDDAGERWRRVRFMVFSQENGQNLGKYAEYVEQVACIDKPSVDVFYQTILEKGGEGIVLRNAFGECFKRKPIEDDDAVVLGYLKGNGRNAGRLGALVVKDSAGHEFRIGTGLRDSDRENPPKAGSIIRFRFQGRTAIGIPRFASYLGIRAELKFV